MNTIKRDPHLQGQRPLEFDELSVDEITAKTDTEKAQLFLEKYKRFARPLTNYRDYFQRDGKEVMVTFALIKNLYVSFVLRDGWSEKKFVASLNHILANNGFLNSDNLSRNGVEYENGRLIQRRRSRRRRL